MTRPDARYLLPLLLAGCGTGPDDPPAAPPPEIAAVFVQPGVGNALSAVATAHLNADSALVRFGAGQSPALDNATPAVRIEGDSAVLPVLGLLPATAYTLQILAYGPGGTAGGESLHVRTDTLPSDLPSYLAGGIDPSPGYVVFAAGGYGLAIDNTGRVVWYVRLERFDRPVAALASLRREAAAGLGRVSREASGGR